MKKVRINNQFDITLPDHRADRPEWYTDEGWEKKRLSMLYKALKPVDIVCYVGAEEGDLAGVCATKGPCMILIEPNEKVWPNIKAIWEANNLPIPFCYVGFAANQTTVPFPEDKHFPECANGEIIGNHGFQTLDEYPEGARIKIDDIPRDITHIVLDVEGWEWEVLRGAEKTIKKHKPKIWLSGHPEFQFRLHNTYLADLRKWLKDFGYKETLIDYPLHEVHLLYV